ncbi:MAG: hypothetical protein HC789_21520 [Microcoleus sp. CSU_2_2]|nr:hypothetical protein [Microcoleus sp. SU_5_3]NJS12765.1 hypothetical protein [Microcoleus sp. CSU_2_2]
MKTQNFNQIVAIAAAATLTLTSGGVSLSLACQETLSPQQEKLFDKTLAISGGGALTIFELLRRKSR